MKFDKVYEQTMHSLLFEQEEEGRVALLPGGFKPPHKGHFQVLKDSIMVPEKDEKVLPPATEAVIFIGKPPRDGITAEQSKDIWKLYTKHIDVPVEVNIAEVSPVTSTYEYACENSNKIIYVVAGEEDLGRYKGFIHCKTDEYAHVEIIPAPPKFDRISGTDTRNAILNRQPDALGFIPEEALSDAEKILQILDLMS